MSASSYSSFSLLYRYTPSQSIFLPFVLLLIPPHTFFPTFLPIYLPHLPTSHPFYLLPPPSSCLPSPLLLTSPPSSLSPLLSSSPMTLSLSLLTSASPIIPLLSIVLPSIILFFRPHLPSYSFSSFIF